MTGCGAAAGADSGLAGDSVAFAVGAAGTNGNGFVAVGSGGAAEFGNGAGHSINGRASASLDTNRPRSAFFSKCRMTSRAAS